MNDEEWCALALRADRLTEFAVHEATKGRDPVDMRTLYCALYPHVLLRLWS